jgi:hypothetical protein
MLMWYNLAADVVVAIHVAYVSFVVLGLLAILLGAALGWQWVRNPWFRAAHLAAIALVALEALFDIVCPLTRWENDLRRLGGGDVSEVTFIGRLLHGLIFYEMPRWFESGLHIGFAVLVLATFVLIPPRWGRKVQVIEPPRRPQGGS